MKNGTKSFFYTGPVSAEQLSSIISEYENGSGAHTIFLGRVRPDKHGDREVVSIEYSAYTEMAEEIFKNICSEVSDKYLLNGINILHSIGLVRSGEISLLVIVSAAHRENCFSACSEAVDRIKSEVPVWGKELFSDAGFQWKKNRLQTNV